MLAFRDFITGLRRLDIDSSRPVMVHASLSAFGEVHGEAETLLGALISSFHTILMPVFTYKTMIIPEMGPADNAVVYGSGKDTNRMAEIFQPDMPADSMMGVVSEALRKHASARRSNHPILSFAGINANQILDTQTLKNPLLPFQELIDDEGWVVLMGVDQTVNTGIHYCEQLSGRMQFTRWALTSRGVVICPGFPGCADGFEALVPHLDGVLRTVELGEGVIQAIPMISLVDIVSTLIKKDPTALLCSREDCQRCNTVRATITEL